MKSKEEFDEANDGNIGEPKEDVDGDEDDGISNDGAVEKGDVWDDEEGEDDLKMELGLHGRSGDYNIGFDDQL